MRKASLGTLFLTVFLDLLGFGLVIPFLPGVARELGASDFVATAVVASYSLMQFLFIPIWGRLSDRIGRRPVLLWSIAATAIGMALLGTARSLPMLLVARLWSGIATANIAVAQAYIADVTTPETRAKGMGMIGMGFGLGFIFGPFIGGILGKYQVLGHEGSLAAFVAAGLSLVNLAFAFSSLPESLAPERRGLGQGIRRSPFDWSALRKVAGYPGVGIAIAVTFWVTFWFAGLEVTFRLFTLDAFKLSIAGTGYVFGFLGVVAAVIQGGLIHRLSRRFGEVKLVRAGLVFLAVGFALDGFSPSVGLPLLVFGSAVLAVGNALYTPSLSSYTSRQTGADAQGVTLGVVQSMGALARVLGPLTGGLLYQYVGMRGPYYVGAIGILGVALLSLRLPPLPARPAAASPPPGAPEVSAK